MKALQQILVLAIAMLVFTPASGTAQNLVQELQDMENVSRFADAIEASDLAEALSNSGPYTIFAPTDEAMEDHIGSRTISEDLIRNHLITGLATERNMRIMSRMTSMGGITIEVTTSGDTVWLNGVSVIRSNIRTDNGVIHIIEGVLD